MHRSKYVNRRDRFNDLVGAGERIGSMSTLIAPPPIRQFLAVPIGAETVRSHLKKAQTKLGVRNRTQAVAEALRQGFDTLRTVIGRMSSQ